MKRKKLFALLMSAVLTLSLTACGSSGGSTGDSSASTGAEEETEAAAEEESSEEAAGLEEDSENVVTEAAAERQEVISVGTGSIGINIYRKGMHAGYPQNVSLIFETLSTQDSSGQLHYALMKSLEEVDSMTYEFTIWDNIYDTDGNHITADDLMFDVDTYIEAGYASWFPNLDHLEKVDDYTLIWHCSTPFGAGELEDEFSVWSIFSQKAFEEHDFENDPVGTGPYKLESFVVDSEMVLTVNEDYWLNQLSPEDQEKVRWLPQYQNFEKIDFHIMNDSSTIAIALENGDVDLGLSLAQIDVDQLDQSKYQISRSTDASPIAAYFNCSEYSICNDPNMRKAIAYAMDGSGIVSGNDVACVEAFGIAPSAADAPSTWSSGRDYYTYDADKVQEYLDAAGYNGETVTLTYSDDGNGSATAVIIQSQLQKAGINCELYGLETAVWQEVKYKPEGDSNGVWDMTLAQIGKGSKYVGPAIYMWHSGDAVAYFDDGRSVLLTADPTLDEYIDAVCADPSEENINAFDEYFTYDQCYALGLYSLQVQSGAPVNLSVAKGGLVDPIWPNACQFNE